MNYIAAKEAPTRATGLVKLHEPADFEGMAKAGRVAAMALDAVGEIVHPGVTTDEIDRFCRQFGEDMGAISACENYRGYTKTICTSINNVICHGIPNGKPLKSGDIVNIDVTYIVDGWHGDSSRMYLVGDVPLKARKLVEVTYEALQIGIAQVKPGNTTGDIGAAIQEFVEGHRYSVVRDFCGHGIGRVFHDAPNILHYGEWGRGLELKEGMFFTIEPMVNAGKPGVKLKSDGWTAVTRDRSLSAQFEHSLGVTADGCQIFTLSPKGYTKPPYTA